MAFKEFLNEKDKQDNDKWLKSNKKDSFIIDNKDPSRRSSLMPM